MNQNSKKQKVSVLEEPTMDITYFDDDRVLMYLQGSSQATIVGFKTQNAFNKFVEQLNSLVPQTKNQKKKKERI